MKSIGKSALVAMLVMAMMLAASSQSLQATQEGTKKVNINTAGVEQLQTLPRIGEKVALRIIDYRKKNGPFKRIEGLLKIKGIGEKTFVRLKDRITI